MFAGSDFFGALCICYGGKHLPVISNSASAQAQPEGFFNEILYQPLSAFTTLKIWSLLAPSVMVMLYLPSLFISTPSFVHVTEGCGSPVNVAGKVTLVPALATVPLGAFVNPGEAKEKKFFKN